MRIVRIIVILFFALSLEAQEPIRRDFPWKMGAGSDPILHLRNISTRDIQIEIRLIQGDDIYRYPSDLTVPAEESNYLRIQDVLKRLSERYGILKDANAGVLQIQFLGKNQELRTALMHLDPKKAARPAKRQQPPTIQSVEPKTGDARGGTVVTITGENFTEGTIVKFGGIPALRNLQSPEILVAVAPAHTAGAVDVEVVTGKKSSGIRNAFTYVSERLAPVARIWSIDPETGKRDGGYQVMLKGENFDRRTRVLFNNKYGETTYISPEAVSAIVPAGESGYVDIAISTEHGIIDTLESAFLYNEPPAIYSVTAVPNPIVRNTTTTITVEATDPEAEPLNYEYRIALGAGTLTNQGRTAVYGSPNVTGPVLIQVTVYDPYRAKSQQNLEITVE